MLVRQEGQLQLGADAIGSADQNGFLHSGDVRFEESAETAHIRHDAVRHGPSHVLLHQLDRLVTGSDVYARRSVCVRS